MALCLVPLLVVAGCGRPAPGDAATEVSELNESNGSYVTFADDLEFLRNLGEVRVLTGPNGQRLAISDQYQGRVMTSATSENGVSFGWINRDFIGSGATGTAFDNYGGEDRFWLGPEGGQYSLYFPADAEFVLQNWQVPPSLQEGAWRVVDNFPSAVTYRHNMALTNYGGATFEIMVDRTIRFVDVGRVSTMLGTDIPDGVEWVAYESLNRVTNRSDERWTPENGLISIWILGMFKPFGTSWVVVPFEGPSTDSVITDAYFGKVPSDRLAIRDGYVLFKADGEYRSKIGIPIEHARPILGSYSPEVGALTIVHFDIPRTKSRYVNSLWEMQEEPYGGDVVNSYNDGPPNPGGFYELESSSPALPLSPTTNHDHRHTTMHFVGDPTALDSIAQAALGVRLKEIRIE